MSLIALLAALVAPALACPSATFTFSGQPDCVELVFTGERTRLTNSCAASVIVDQSVQVAAEGAHPAGRIPPDTVTEIRDLSAFTMGMDGELFRVVAAIADTDACEDTAPPPVDTDPPPVDTASKD